MHFLLKPGYWLGKGKIHFSFSPNELAFCARWVIAEIGDNLLECTQIVELEMNVERHCNRFLISNLSASHFDISLENEMIERTFGQGHYDQTNLSFEFKGDSSIKGYENYVREGAFYQMKGAYFGDDSSTLLTGTVWEKGKT